MSQSATSSDLSFFSIRNPLYFAIVFQIIIAIFVGLIGFKGMQSILLGFSNTYEQRILPLNELKIISDRYSVDITQTVQQVRDGSLGAYEAAEQISEAFEDIETAWNKYLSYRHSPEEILLQEELKPNINAGREMILKTVEQLEMGATMEIHFLAETELYPTINSLVEGLGDLIDQLLVLVESDYQNQKAEFDQSILLVITVISFAALASAAAGYYFARVILMQPLGAAMKFAYEIAKGNLRAEVMQNRRDEIGQLVGSLLQMRDELRAIVAVIQGNSQEIATASDEFNTATNSISNATGLQSEEALKISSAIQQMRASISSINELTSEAKSLSFNSGNLAKKGKDMFSNVIGNIQQVARVAEDTSAAVGSLGQRSSEITQVVTVIRDVAEQTNLLALNAAIEAARAGEQGRGFSVVADEVRHLAERTSASTHEISRMVDLITTGTAEVVKAMKEQVFQVENAVEQAYLTDSVIQEINTASQEAVDRVALVSRALDEQTQMNAGVASSIEQIAEMSEQNNSASTEVALSSQRLAELAGELGQTVKRFNL